jgi:preprotein translocase subunit YajC
LAPGRTRSPCHCFRLAARYSPRRPEAQPARAARAGRKEKRALFITPAFAQGAGAAQGGITDLLQTSIPIIMIILIMYFLLLRPQQKRQREHADLVKNVRRGDTVVMNGGLIGKISKVVDDAELEIEIAPNIKVRVARAMIATVRAKGEPVKDAV